MQNHNYRLIALLCSTLLFTACSDDEKSRLIPTDRTAIINSVAPDYTTSDLELVDLDGTSLSAVAGNYGGASDYTVSSHGEYFYRIGRYNIDTVTKYSIKDPATAIYQYSTLDDADDPSSNPASLVFVSDTKAYLIRYASDKLWIVNPSATSEAAFKTGEIDLSAYNAGDGDVPEMQDGVVVDGKLYLTLQRLDGWNPEPDASYVVVINTATDTEIDTNPADDPATLKGIQLIYSNPQSIAYHPKAGLFVQSIGNWWCYCASEAASGIEKINTTNYSTESVIAADESSGIDNVAIVSETLGYISKYAGWADSTLFSFNPGTGEVADEPVSESLAGIELSGLTVDEDDLLWVSVSDYSSPHVTVIDTHNPADTVTVATTYNPGKVVFASAYVRIKD